MSIAGTVLAAIGKKKSKYYNECLGVFGFQYDIKEKKSKLSFSYQF
jgi:hypothetical protein